MSNVSNAATTEEMREMYRTAAKGSMGSDQTVKAAEELHQNMAIASIDGRSFQQSSVTDVRIMSERTGREYGNDITVAPDGEDIHTLT